jgi:hypothetical protein
VLREYSDTLLLVLDLLGTSVFSLSARWFIVELSVRLATGTKYRQGTVGKAPLVQSAKQPQRLFDVNLQPNFTTFHAAGGEVDFTLSSRGIVDMLDAPASKHRNFPGGGSTWSPTLALARTLAPLNLPLLKWKQAKICGASSSISAPSRNSLCTSVSRLPAAWDLVQASSRGRAVVSQRKQIRPSNGSLMVYIDEEERNRVFKVQTSPFGDQGDNELLLPSTYASTA